MGLHVIQCHKELVLTAATGLCHMTVKIINKRMQYMHIKTIHREMKKLQSIHIAKYCTLGSNISTGGSNFILLQSFQLTLQQSIILYLSCYATSITYQNLSQVAGNNTHHFLW
jgi:hypothetical protein